MNIDPEVSARYGRLTIGWYLAVNALLMVVVAGGSWYFAARANNRGIPPNTALGFRSQYTLSSLHGWYVAQRVGFHFVAVAATVIAIIVFAVVAFAFIRRSNPMWMLFVPVVGELAIAGCFIIAGQHADQAAISVEKPAALGSVQPAKQMRGAERLAVGSMESAADKAHLRTLQHGSEFALAGGLGARRQSLDGTAPAHG